MRRGGGGKAKKGFNKWGHAVVHGAPSAETSQRVLYNYPGTSQHLSSHELPHHFSLLVHGHILAFLAYHALYGLFCTCCQSLLVEVLPMDQETRQCE